MSEAHEESSTSHSAVVNNHSSLLSSLPRLPTSNGYSRINGDEIEEEELQDLSRNRTGGSSTRMDVDTALALDDDDSIQSSSGGAAETGVRATMTSTIGGIASRSRFPAAAGARRMIQQTVDGVFSNLSAKPRVEKPYQEELPPVSLSSISPLGNLILKGEGISVLTIATTYSLAL